MAFVVSHSSARLPTTTTNRVNTLCPSKPFSVPLRNTCTFKQSTTFPSIPKLRPAHPPTTMTAPVNVDLPTLSHDPPPAPPCIAETSAVVVGSGPVGATMAALLHKRRIPVTVVERSEDFRDFDISRMYNMSINKRGTDVFDTLPELFDRIKQEAIETDLLNVVMLDYQKNISVMPMAAKAEYKTYFAMRPNVSIAMRDHILSLERRHDSDDPKSSPVKCMYGTSVETLDIHDDGSMTLSVRSSDGTQQSLRTKLLFACDGRNSTVLSLLRKAHEKGAAVHTSAGLDDYVKTTYSSDVHVKALRVNATVDELYEENTPAEKKKELDLNEMHFAMSSKPDLGFQMVLFGMSPACRELLGGRLGTFCGLPNHKPWKAKTVEEGFSMLEDAFPQMDVRKFFSEESVRRFVNARPSPFGDLRRCNSLMALVGQRQEGGVVFLGDAAHSMPPDMGQGLNSGVQDAGVFADCVDALAAASGKGETSGTGLAGVLRNFEARRQPAIDGLVYVTLHASPWQYGQNKFRQKLWFVKFMAHRKLESWVPWLVNPPLSIMLRLGYGYSEVKAKSLETCRNLLLASASVTTAAVAVGYMAYLRR